MKTPTASPAPATLRQPQVRVLAALAKAKGPLTRKEIASAAPCDLAWCTEFLGSSDPAIRAKNDAKFPSLLTLGLIKAAEGEEGGTVYAITAKGRRKAVSGT